MAVSLKKYSPQKIRQTLDLPESLIAEKYPEAFRFLLYDTTTEKNIVWASNDYADICNGSELRLYPREEADELIAADIVQNFIRPRCAKASALRRSRTRFRAEVFTPPRICNAQNNLLDENWFGRKRVFNKERRDHGIGWASLSPKISPSAFDSAGRIAFPRGKNWRDYVRDSRMEIACGEAPYLVSRYDCTRGRMIPLRMRIGILDRKLRIVSENTETPDDFLEWAKVAFQSVYGFELQGDSLLLARENVLFSFYDYFHEKFGNEPTREAMRDIAEIVAWNIFQMDAETLAPPFATARDDLFGGRAVLCRIKDWATGEILEFKNLLKK